MDRQETELESFWNAYRDACPEPEPGPGFVPSIWRRIEARQSFWYAFGRSGRVLSLASAIICLVLLALNAVPHFRQNHSDSSYTDALVADRSAERMSYAEAVDRDFDTNGFRR